MPVPHRIHEACGRGVFALKDIVEVDGTCIGGKRRNMSNSRRKSLAGPVRSTVVKVSMAGMCERSGKVKAKATDAATLFENVLPGTTVYTDEASACGPLKHR